MTRIRRFAALVCVAAYLSGGIQVVPEVLALGAWLEGSHSVGVTLGADQVTVVLSHTRAGQPNFSGANPIHHHGPVARVICLLSTAQTRPDHVAGFSPTQLSESPRAVSNITAKQALRDIPMMVPPEAHPPVPFQVAAETRSTDWLFNTLEVLQSTVLII